MPPRPIIPVLENPRDEPLICLQINAAWIAALMGIVRPYQYPEQWRGTLEENQQARLNSKILLDILAESIGCDTMTECCYVTEQTTVIEHRLNPITLQLEISVDGGQTWTPDPQSVENQIIELPAPVTSGVSATKCDAATNGLEHIRDEVAGISANLNIGLTLADFIVEIVTLILLAILTGITGGAASPAFVAMIGIITASARGVYAAGKQHFDDFWIEANYDKVLCCLYCNIGDDGRFTQEQFTSFINQWNRDLGGDYPSTIIRDGIVAAGKKGLNQLCAYGNAADADCDGCDCSCSNNFTVVTGTHLQIPYYEGYDSYVSAAGIPGTGTAVNIRTADKDSCCTVLDVKFDIIGDRGGGFTPFSIYKWNCGVVQDDGNQSGGALLNACINRVQPMTHPVNQAGITFVMSVLWGDCP